MFKGCKNDNFNANMPMQYVAMFKGCKNDNLKLFFFFFFFFFFFIKTQIVGTR